MRILIFIYIWITNYTYISSTAPSDQISNGVHQKLQPLSLNSQYGKIKEFEHVNADSLKFYAEQLQLLHSSDSTNIILGQYYSAKADLLKFGGFRETNRLLSLYEQMDTEEHEPLKAEIDLLLADFFYNNLMLEKASNRLESAMEYIYKKEYDLVRAVMIDGLSFNATIADYKEKLNQINATISKLDQNDWSFYHSKLHRSQAKALARLGRFEESYPKFQFLIEKNTEHNLRDELVYVYDEYSQVLERDTSQQELAYEYIQKTIDESQATGMTTFLSLTYRRLGHFHFKNDQFKEAFNSYSKAVHNDSIYDLSEAYAYDNVYKGWSYLHLDREKHTEEAIRHYDLAISTATSDDLTEFQSNAILFHSLQYKLWSLPPSSNQKFEIKQKFEKAKKKLEEHESILKISDFQSQMKLRLTDMNIKIENLALTNKLKDEDLRKSRYLLLLALMMLILATVIIRSYKKRASYLEKISQKDAEIKRKNKVLESTITVISSKNKQLEDELKSKLMLISDNFHVLEQVATKVKDSKNLNAHEKSQFLKTIDSKITKKLIEEIDFKFIRQHEYFQEKLLSKHKNITQNNVKLCIYLKMNLSTKEIATLTYSSIASIKVAKSRLKKKLGIDNPDINLNTYLSTLASS